MSDAVRIPINLEVTDLDISTVNTKDLEKGLTSQLKGVRKVFEDTMKSLDASPMSKEFMNATKELNSSFRNAEKSVQNFSKATKDLEKGKASAEDVQKAYDKIGDTFDNLTGKYENFSKDVDVESTLTAGFRNTLGILHDVMSELKMYQQFAESAAKSSNTTAEYWEALDIHVKSAKAGVQSILTDLRAMTKDGSAFKMGAGEDTVEYYKHLFKSIQGSAQASANRSNVLIGDNRASQELIEAKIEADKLAHSLQLAKYELEAMKQSDAGADKIREMEAHVSNLAERLGIVDNNYQTLYNAAYGVADATADAEKRLWY